MNLVRFFHWQIVRYVARHKLLAVFNALSIALGVAVFLAIQLVNEDARRAFSASIDVVAGKAQLEVSAPANDLPDAAFPEVQRTTGVKAATPLVRGIVTLPEFPGEYLDVLGIDIFTNAPFRTFDLTNFDTRDFDIEQWLRAPGAIAVSDSFAARHHLKRGDVLRVQLNGEERSVRVLFVINSAEAAGVDRHFAAMDIGWAQEFFGSAGRLNSIQVQLDPGSRREDVSSRLRSKLPADVEVSPPARRTEQIDEMLGAFQVNLTAMSLVSLFVGSFLVFNTISASVIRRRHEIGILRAIGASRIGVGMIFVGEALVFAAIGTLLGLLVGTFLARSLLGAASETISSLYILVSVRDVGLNPWSYAEATILGMGSAAIASIFPAASAARMQPVAALHPEVAAEGGVSRSLLWTIAGLFAIGGIVVTAMIALNFGPAWLSFLCAFLCLAALACFAPGTTTLVSRSLFALLRLKRSALLSAELAVLSLQRALARNAVTIAALASAIAMTIGVSVMIFSFRQTVNTWINETLVADLFVTPSSNEIAGPSSFLAPAVISFFENHRGVLAVDTFRYVEVPFRAGRMSIAGIRADGPRVLDFVSGGGAHLMEVFRRERCAMISESFARHQHLGAGDSLEIATPKGNVVLPIAAVFYDYSRDEGIVFVSARTFTDLFDDARVNSIGIYLNQVREIDQLSDEFQRQFNQHGGFAIYSNRALRERVFEVFDQTFAITYTLRGIAIIVAIAGIFLSFTTLVMERARSLGIMRAIGLSGRQMRATVLWESVFVSVIASVLGSLAGVGLSVILTEVVNRAFFGWTIKLQIPGGILFLTPVWIVGAGLVAAILPAFRASTVDLAEVLRAE